MVSRGETIALSAVTCAEMTDLGNGWFKRLAMISLAIMFLLGFAWSYAAWRDGLWIHKIGNRREPGTAEWGVEISYGFGREVALRLISTTFRQPQLPPANDLNGKWLWVSKLPGRTHPYFLGIYLRTFEETDAKKGFVWYGTTTELLIPIWMLFALTAILPMWWRMDVARQRRIRRERFYNWQCMECGYDLRGSPEKCPECGMVPPKRL
jgi:hypothetical protein